MFTLAAASLDLRLFFQQVENGITLGAMYALVALGYTLVYGIIELINFAHGDVFMWSTVVVLAVVQAMGIKGPPPGLALVGLLILLIVIGMLVSATINVSIERIAYRRLRTAPRLAPLIAAIGASFVLENVAQLWRGAGFTSFPGIFPPGGLSIGGVNIDFLDIMIVLVAVGLMIALDRFIRGTKMGRSMRATAQDPEAAALMGVNIDRTISLTFLIGGALAGAAGVFYSMYVGQVWFFTGFQLGLIAFTAAVLGGIGNIYGAVLGGFVIGLIQAIAIQYIPNGVAWSDATVFAILVLILVFRPSGLLGQQVPNKV
ncbi:MAG TPA: branched-chain amino acid ABC transporter permease [Ktedonobacterales bacterium]|jgi:branched-chain amino acid transport system permease protein|nr:branched-chain amino acid ABC transporter permease [Ktedonobacterales bacterium]